MKKWFSVVLLGVMALSALLPTVASADEYDVTNVGTLVGVIESVTDSSITIAGVTVNISSADVQIEYHVGDVVSIDALLSDSGSWNGLVIVAAEEDIDLEDGDLIIIGVLDESDDEEIIVSHQKIKVKKNEIKLETWINGAKVKVKIKMKDGEWDAVKVDYHVPKGEHFSGVDIHLEGPVDMIDGNLVSIFGTYVVLDPDMLELTVLELGDIIRVSGVIDSQAGVLLVLVIQQIIFINVEVYIFEGLIWRDHGTCISPPPVWAEANAWHFRCDADGSKKSKKSNKSNKSRK